MKLQFIKLQSTLPLLASTLLLTGCINMELLDQYTKDGDVFSTMIMDMSPMEEMTGEPMTWEQMEEQCEKTLEDQKDAYTQRECTVVNSTTIKFTGKKIPAPDQPVFTSYKGPGGETVYSLEIRRKPDNDALSELGINEEEAAQAVSEFGEGLTQSMFQKFTYEITMPGRITRADVGTITSSNTVLINMLEDGMLDIPSENKYIESTVGSPNRRVARTMRRINQPRDVYIVDEPSTTAPQHYKSAQEVQYESKFHERVCGRVAKYKDQGLRVYNRVLKRVERRFGFSC